MRYRLLEPNPSVLLRFALRTFILCALSALIEGGAPRRLPAVFNLASLLAIFVAMTRGEKPLAAALNHWDEAMAFSAIALGLYLAA